MTAPRRGEHGETSTLVVLALTLFFVAVVVGTTSAWVNSQVNARAADGIEATSTVAKCVFQLSAYRAQYSEAARPPEVATGQDPYAGLDLPTPEQIRRYYAAHCQRYLEPFGPIDEADALGLNRTPTTRSSK